MLIACKLPKTSRRIVATYNTPGDLTVTGSTLKAGNDMTLEAANDLQLRSAQNTQSSTSQNKSSSASMGVNVSLNGTVTPIASLGGAEGNSDGTTLTHTETTLQAGNTLSTQSGRDTTLKGAIAQGDTVSMKVGGNLTLESEQDSANFKQKQTSANATFALGNNALSSSASAGQNKVDSTYQSVKEQTGIYAGDGGFNITVNGNTTLKGAVIDASLTAQAQGNNQLTTGTLTTQDIRNQREYQASASNVGVSKNLSLNPATQGDQQPADSPAGTLPKEGVGGLAVADSGQANRTTKSAIAAGTITITDNAGQQAQTGKDANQTVATLNRDTQHANGSIDNPFNQEKVQEQLEFLQLAGQLVIQPVAAQAAKWIGDTLDGTNKVAAHAVLGAAVTTLLGTSWQTGAAAGALGDLLPQALEKAFEKDENGKIKNEEAFKAANTIISAALTSTTGGDIANTINAGMVTQNAVENNWLSHQRPSAAQLSEAEQYAYAMKACTAGNQSQCNKAHDLEATSKQRDLALNLACADGPSAGCSEMARFAVNDGNVLIKGTDGQIYVVSKDEPLLKTPARPQGFDQEIAPSIIDAALQETGGYYVGKLLSVAKPLAVWATDTLGITTKNIIVEQANRTTELVEWFSSADTRAGLQIGNRSLVELPSSGSAKIVSGATDEEVKAYFLQLTGRQELPLARPVIIKGEVASIYTVRTSQGNFNLRSGSASITPYGKPAWTIDVPKKLVNAPTNEIKFVR